MTEEGPKSLGNVRELHLTGAVFPWDELRQMPVFLGMPGAPRDLFPIFSDADLLQATMRRAGATFDKIKQINDGHEFLESLVGLGRDFDIAFDPRFQSNGRVRFHQVVLD